MSEALGNLESRQIYMFYRLLSVSVSCFWCSQISTLLNASYVCFWYHAGYIVAYYVLVSGIGLVYQLHPVL